MQEIIDATTYTSCVFSRTLTFSHICIAGRLDIFEFPGIFQRLFIIVNDQVTSATAGNVISHCFTLDPSRAKEWTPDGEGEDGNMDIFTKNTRKAATC